MVLARNAGDAVCAALGGLGPREHDEDLMRAAAAAAAGCVAAARLADRAYDAASWGSRS